MGDQRTEHIEGRLIALLHLLFDFELDLVQRHVTRTFDNHLPGVLGSTTGQLAEGLQLSQVSRMDALVVNAMQTVPLNDVEEVII